MPRYERTKSGKTEFWEIDGIGDTLTMESGTTGTKGTSESKKFQYPYTAQIGYFEEIGRRLREGFQRVDGPSSPDRRAARDRLSFLAESPACRAILDHLVEGAEKIEDNSGVLTLFFPETDEPWTVYPPGEKLKGTPPPALARIFKHCSGTHLGAPGTSALVLHGGMKGNLHALGGDAGLDEERDGFSFSLNLCAPIDHGFTQFYLFHPKTGKLCLFDQDGGLDLNPPYGEIGDGWSVGGTFLRVLLKDLTLWKQAPPRPIPPSILKKLEAQRKAKKKR